MSADRTSIHSLDVPPQHSSLQQGELVELEITDVSDGGEGVGRVGDCVVFVPDTVTGDRAIARLVRVKKQYAQGKLHELVTRSPHRVRPSCMVADKCGGCQLQHIDYAYQLISKENQVIQALKRIGGFSEPPVAKIVGAGGDFAYRNKVTYPLGIGELGQIKAGYYRKGTHQIVNLNQCPVQDVRLNPLLAEVKEDIQQRGWQIYQEEVETEPTQPRRELPKPILKRQRTENMADSSSGVDSPTKPPSPPKLRHLSFRIGRHTGEILLTLVATAPDLPEIEVQAREWLDRYPNLVGVCLNINERSGNVIFGGETYCVAGRDYLREEFGGLQFQLKPDTFFQVYTEQAESVLDLIINRSQLQGDEVLVDAYCGIGTFTLPLAQRVKQAIGIEIYPNSVEQAEINASLNAISNVIFQVGKVEELLPLLAFQPDIVLLDPPRQGCDRPVLDALLELKPRQIIYISCKPSTLARDLKILCENDGYQLTHVQPADFFPQTAHVECVAFLARS
jgi:23S rRNA (uracil1939-C5)-methyltransferase